jgi:hypothetical protein
MESVGRKKLTLCECAMNVLSDLINQAICEWKINFRKHSSEVSITHSECKMKNAIPFINSLKLLALYVFYKHTICTCNLTLCIVAEKNSLIHRIECAAGLCYIMHRTKLKFYGILVVL